MSTTSNSKYEGKGLKLALAAAALGMSIGVSPATTLAAVGPNAEKAGPVADKPAETEHLQVADLRPANPDVRYIKWARPPATSIKYNLPSMKVHKLKELKERKGLKK